MEAFLFEQDLQFFLADRNGGILCPPSTLHVVSALVAKSGWQIDTATSDVAFRVFATVESCSALDAETGERVFSVGMMTCPSCGRRFKRSPSYVRAKLQAGQRYFFCSRKCRTPAGAVNHGTRTAYYHHKCRCALCRAANAEAVKRYRRQAM